MRFRFTLKHPARVLASICVLSISVLVNAQQVNGCWTLHSTLPAAKNSQSFWIAPTKFQLSELDAPALLADLQNAPHEHSVKAKTAPFTISLPGPTGQMETFTLEEYSMMEPELAEKFPTLKTYKGVGVDDPTARIQADWTEQGFHASIFSESGSWYIDPLYKQDTSYYASYNRKDLPNTTQWQCHTSETTTLDTSKDAGKSPRVTSGAVLHTYRLACAATGEYTAFHGGTVSNGLSAIVTAVNRINQIYESELSVRFVLIGNNNLLVYTNAGTDPYTNNAGYDMLSENQTNLTAVIGAANYDIGHVFSTGGGGIASISCVCWNSFKGQGVTGSNVPVGDPFYVDYVAHEMGHQFGANHTFNSESTSCITPNRNSSTAHEPGSGSTIMAYAGICPPDDLQNNSDPYFHSRSIEEILSFLAGAGGSCAVKTSTGNNPPVVEAGNNYTIPAHTPFTLTASGTDLNGNQLTYSWEERALGPSRTLADPDNGTSPNYRVFNPSSSPARHLPRLSSVLGNSYSSSEKWYDQGRNVTYMVTARDGLGGLHTDTMQLTVANGTGPFQVTYPNSAGVYSGNVTITWNVAGTSAAPVSASNVSILLSLDSGLSFPVALEYSTPNDGSHQVTLPNINTTKARIQIRPTNNIFWAVNNSDITIAPTADVHDWSLYSE